MVREHARRDFRGAHVIRHRAGLAASPLVVVGDGRSGSRVVGVGQLQRLGHTAVQEGPPRRADLAIGGVPQQVVEVVVAGRRVLADDAAPPQLVYCPDHRVAVKVAGLGEQVEGEVAADNRGQLSDLARGRARLPYPVGQHGADPGPRVGGIEVAGSVVIGRDRRLVTGVRRAGRPAQLPRPDRFDDEQWVPTGRRVQPLRVPAHRHGAENLACELGGASGVQRRQVHVSDLACRAQRPQRLGELSVSLGLLRPGRGEHEQRVTLAEVQQQLQPGQGVLVAPLEIVQHQQSRPASRQHRPGQALQEPVALPGVGHRARQGHGVGASGRHQPVDLAGPYRLQPVAGRPQRRAAQPLRHRGEREPPAGRETAGAHGVGPGALDQRGQLVQQPALADAGLAGDQDETGLPGHGLVPALLQQRQFAFAADQPQRAGRRDRAGHPGRCHRPGHARHRGRLAGRQPFVFGGGRPIRRDPELTLQN
jgi:hypothetical protein